MGLYLPNLHIKGFRCFEDLEIPELSRVNLIVGRNAVGKTALLEAISVFAAGQWVPERMLEIARDRQETQVTMNDPARHNWRREARLFFHNAATNDDEPVEFVISGAQTGHLLVRFDWLQQGGPGHWVKLKRNGGPPLAASELGFGIGRNSPDLHYVPLHQIPRRSPVLGDERLLPGEDVEFIDLRTTDAGALWSDVSLKPAEEEVVKSLRVAIPIDRIGYDIPRERTKEGVFRVRMIGATEPVSLASLGDGASQLLRIVLGLITAPKGKVILIDEIETGFHYSILPDLWRMVIDLAARRDVQVFATTHSNDCLLAFQEASEQRQDGLLLRLERRPSRPTVAVSFPASKLAIVARDHIEIR